MTITILCVMKSGGIYDSEWVRKLRDATTRNLTVPHRFECLSDVEVPSKVPLKHDWPGWWSKIEIFRPSVVSGPTLYLDLDVVITGNMDHLTDLDYDFAMLENFHQPGFVNSSVMWFRNEKTVPHKVYERFAKMPDAYIGHYKRMQHGTYIGDQAFVWDSMGGKIDLIRTPSIRSYKFHCRSVLPEQTSVVCFHGPPRPSEVKAEWLERNWF